MFSSKNKCKHVALQLDPVDQLSHRTTETAETDEDRVSVNGVLDDVRVSTYKQDASDLRKRNKTAWRKNRILTAYSTVTTLALVFCIVLLILKYILNVAYPSDVYHKPADRVSENDFCLNPTCISLADIMIKKVNYSVKPCDDFYEYACGRWIGETQIPEGHFIWHTFAQATLDKYSTLKSEVERPSYQWGRVERIVETVYNACMNEEALAKEGIEPLKSFLGQLGGWGLASNRILVKSSWSLEETLLKMYELNFNPILLPAVVTDDKNTSRNVIALDQPNLSLRMREAYVDRNTSELYTVDTSQYMSILQQTVVSVATLLGATQEWATNYSEKLIIFEAELARTMPTMERRKAVDKIYYLTNVSEIISLVPQINWKLLLGRFFGKKGPPMNEQIVVYGLEWLKDLGKLVQKYSSTLEGKQIMDDYIKWYAAYNMMPYLDKNVFNSSPGINFFTGGLGFDRWADCLMKAEYLLSLPVSKLFVKSQHAKIMNDQVSLIVDYIVQELIKELELVAWMDETTKARALKKVSKLIKMIGYGDEFLNATYLEDVYKSFDLTERNYFKAALATRSYISKENAKTLREAVVRTQWSQSAPPSTLNAYYTFPLNRIVIPLAVLAYPIFLKDAPMAFNFGSLGNIIGHEASHGFDELGRLYDENGNLQNWWQQAAFDEFGSRSQCLVRQYSNYSLYGVQINGQLTLNENIADNGGVKIAYKAFRRWSEKNNSTTLPGLNATADQLFFLGFAQFWCSNSFPDFRKVLLESSIHSPEKYRVIGPLSNLQEFSNAFSCPQGSVMNRESKCDIW